MNTIVALIMSAALTLPTAVAVPRETNYYCYNGPLTEETKVSWWKETEWPLGETITEEYTLTYDEFINR